MFKIKIDKPKIKKLKTKKSILLIVFIFAFIGLTIFYLYSNKNKDDAKIPQNSQQPMETYKEGPGGDPSLVISYHDQAVTAFKAGDKEKAKELAIKGLDENSKLTEAQQAQIQGQMKIVYDMSDISKGIYFEAENGPFEQE
ncbi:hypothetical protein HZB74_01210 [Candidatus Saccharibacteria bacterium]|nr:hypothetical protein [Candidatus Saccharibacteria bacterium]